MRFLKNKLFLVVTVMLLIGLPVAIWQLNESQDLRQRASTTESIVLKLNPNTGNITVNSDTDIAIALQTNNKDIGAIEFEVEYSPTTTIDVLDFTSDTSLLPIQETGGNGLKKFTLVNVSDEEVRGNVTLGKLKLKGLTVGTGTVKLKNIKATASGISDYLQIETTSVLQGTYTVTTADPCNATTNKPNNCTCTANNQCTSNNCITATGGGKTCQPQNSNLPACGTPSTIPPATGNAPLTVTLHGSGSNVVGYQWDFDGNGTWDSNTQLDPIQHTYTTAGTFNPKYRVAGANNTFSAACNYGYPVVVSSPNSTLLNLNLSLPGIGGNPNVPGQGETANTENPERTSRNADVVLRDQAGNILDNTFSGSLVFDPASYTYKGSVNLGNTNTGNYEVLVRLDNTLYSKFPGFPLITKSQTTTTQPLKLISGDLTGNTENFDILNLDDYILFKACFQEKPLCNTNAKTKADLNDNGEMDIYDATILLNGFANRTGALQQ